MSFVKLGEIADFSNEVNFSKTDYGAGAKLIAVSDFGDRSVPDYETLQEVNKRAVKPNDYLHENDIVFVRSNGNKALVGRCMLISNAPDNLTYSGFCIRMRLHDVASWNPKFLMYYFKSKAFRSSISTSASGTNIQNLNQGILSNHKIQKIDLEQQCRIANILSAYDALVENNRKQIKLLEEAAQRLYKEWFVDLRFPGHETTPIDPTTNLPEGWVRAKLMEVASFKRGKTITKEQTEDGTIPVVAGGLQPAYYHSKVNTKYPVVTVSGSGANAGYTSLHLEPIWASDCSFVDLNATPFIYFVYETVKVLGNDFAYLQRGSAQPHVYPKDINDLDIVFPIMSIVEEFDSRLEGLFGKVRILQHQIKLSKEARDRLLPKLMSSELEV